ncbi:hypothetical protein BDN72DRAFT_806767 [Pluteus cervinus]|uniref:Uncharacterized protein n=1 Tax=Pluteus cervinus TaxID=181527 RepID=A0ACD3BFW1_9AGAR|nr:hypothetical protein BDN72DRAFT_806767 [Pluteus cervinus]
MQLLGSECQDMDIALSEIMGLTFAQYLADFASTKGVQTGNISKIAQNPDQSKHLETATFKLFGFDLDLVNLRAEEYAESSRIPTEVSFGTPLQDALRRDLTINALFYNVHTRKVEDFTEKGLDDLKNGIVRTPLPPKETFLDDPLRVLRCIRFASRYGFDIVPEIADAAKDLVVQEALVTKVARERVGTEFYKMITGRNPLRSIELIHEFNLYHAIFSVLPPDSKDLLSHTPEYITSSLAASSILSLLLGRETAQTSDIPALHPLLLSATKADPSCISRLYLGATLTPSRGITYKDKKQKDQPVVELLIRESVKLGTQNHYLDGVPLLFVASEMIKQPSLDKFSHPSKRVALGKMLREKAVHNPHTGSHWSSSFLFSLVQELVPLYNVRERSLDVQGVTQIMKLYNAFADCVEKLGLADTGDAKYLLTGREVQQALEVPKAGPWIGEALNKVFDWQLDHPEGTKDECIEWLKQLRDSGKLKITDNKSEPPAKKIRMK